MKSTVWLPGLLLAAVLVLPGCALVRTERPAPALTSSQQRLYQLNSWHLDGRIGVQTPQDGWSANLSWDHEGRQDRLRVSGPFSQGMVSIVLQDDLIYINEGDGTVATSRDPDALLKARLGFAVPLASLRYWVLGLPAPGQDEQAAADEHGGAKGFRQQGWVLAFEQFTQVRGLSLPQKMTIRGHEVKLKLIADEWVLKE